MIKSQRSSAETGLASRLVFGLCSQALSSGGNFLCLVLAARAGTAIELGPVALSTTLYVIALGSGRALLADPLLIRYQNDFTEFEQRNSSANGLYFGSFVSIVLGLAQVISYLTQGGVHLEILWLSLCLPFLIFTDCQRYQYFSVSKPHFAAVIDGSWLALFVLGCLIFDNLTSLDVWKIWCVTGAFTGLLSLVQQGGLPPLSVSKSWVQKNLDLGKIFLLENLASGLVVSISLALLAARSGTLIVGSIKSSLSLFGPLIVIFMSAQTALMGIARRSQRDLRRIARLSTAVMAGSAFCLTVVLALLPNTLGRAILGQTWVGAHKVVWLIGAATIASVSSTGAVLGLRALEAGRPALRARLLSAPAALVFPPVLGIAFGAQGFGIGYAAANIIGTVFLWRAYLVQARVHYSSTPEAVCNKP